jgi:hypothetical protein
MFPSLSYYCARREERTKEWRQRDEETAACLREQQESSAKSLAVPESGKHVLSSPMRLVHQDLKKER